MPHHALRRRGRCGAAGLGERERGNGRNIVASSSRACFIPLARSFASVKSNLTTLRMSS